MKDELLAGGFRLTRFVERPDGQYYQLLPPRVITFSDELSDVLPGVWALDWVEPGEGGREIEASKFGFRGARLKKLVAWTSKAFDDGAFLWQNLFSTLDAARSFCRDFDLMHEDLLLLGLGFDPAVADELREDPEIPDGNEAPGVIEALARRSALPEGKLLGWEILSTDQTGAFESWLSHGLEQVVHHRQRIRLNTFGLIDDREQAEEAAQLCRSEKAPNDEPTPWFPVAVVRYALSIENGPA